MQQILREVLPRFVFCYATRRWVLLEPEPAAVRPLLLH